MVLNMIFYGYGKALIACPRIQTEFDFYKHVNQSGMYNRKAEGIQR